MSDTIFDIAFVGAGAAALHTAMAMVDEDRAQEWKILLIDPSLKDSDDRTWCFWEKGEGRWDELLHASWSAGTMRTNAGQAIDLEMGGYAYKMLRSSAFYGYAKARLAAHQGVEWVKAKVSSVEPRHDSDWMEVETEKGRFRACRVVDSRIPKEFSTPPKGTINLLQHFKGLFIRHEEEVFDPSRFVMMDFSMARARTEFFYVLPLNKKEALIEHTLFTGELLKDEEYDAHLKEYINNRYPGNYDILESEQGVIPMSTFDFAEGQRHEHLRIGTAGGWVKPSTGYHFKNAERFGRQLATDFVKGKKTSFKPWSSRHRYYDALLLDILERDNALGSSIFSRMYERFAAWQIFRFLDEQSTFSQEVRIMAGFDPRPFLKSLWRSLTK